MFDNSSNDTLLERLIEASTFGLDDLVLNRQGRMSGLQRSRLALMTIFYFGVCVMSFTLAFGALWLFFKQSQSIPFLAILFWVIFFTYGGFYWLREALPMWADVRSNTVLCVSGPLRQFYTQISNGRAPIYLVHYRIAKKFFDVAFFAPKFIPQDQKCHAYYTLKSEILVGIEPI